MFITGAFFFYVVTDCICIEFARPLTMVLISFVELVMFCADYGDVSAVSELQQALQEYLPVLLGLITKGFSLLLFSSVIHLVN
jgi:hypothetical protein